MNITGIALQGLCGREETVAIEYAMRHNLPYRHIPAPGNVPQDWLPVGGVPWTEAILGCKIIPEYYPDWAPLRRSVWRQETWPLRTGVFIKPADRYKRFTGFIYKYTNKERKKGPVWCSEFWPFIREWRLYVATGKVVASAYYEAPECIINTPPPQSFWASIPTTWCGAIDMGVHGNGDIEVVECQHPYAIGWYGGSESNDTYIQFLLTGWEYMCKYIKS